MHHIYLILINFECYSSIIVRFTQIIIYDTFSYILLSSLILMQKLQIVNMRKYMLCLCAYTSVRVCVCACACACVCVCVCV